MLAREPLLGHSSPSADAQPWTLLAYGSAVSLLSVRLAYVLLSEGIFLPLSFCAVVILCAAE